MHACVNELHTLSKANKSKNKNVLGIDLFFHRGITLNFWGLYRHVDSKTDPEHEKRKP